MSFSEKYPLNLFELTSQTLQKVNDLGKVKLSNFDISYQFAKDGNQLDDQMNFYLYIFGVEFSQTIYSKKYNTLDKMLKLLWSNLKKEYMYKNVREGLIFTKIKSLKEQLYETIKVSKAHITQLNNNSELGVIIDIEERRASRAKDKNGLPFFDLTVKCAPLNIDINLPLEANTSDWDMDKTLALLKQKL